MEGKVNYWLRSNPSLEGRSYLSKLEPGGCTQYRTMVQGMPAEVEKRIETIIADIVWSGRQHLVNKETMALPHYLGGKQVLDVPLRNDAIYLCLLQCFLQGKVKWVALAMDLMYHDIPHSRAIPDREAIVNIFLQTWDTAKQAARSTLPLSTRKMMEVARKYGSHITLHLSLATSDVTCHAGSIPEESTTSPHLKWVVLLTVSGMSTKYLRESIEKAVNKQMLPENCTLFDPALSDLTEVEAGFRILDPRSSKLKWEQHKASFLAPTPAHQGWTPVHLTASVAWNDDGVSTATYGVLELGAEQRTYQGLVPPNLDGTLHTALAIAVLKVLDTIDRRTNIRFSMTSQHLADTLTKNLKRCEDMNWASHDVPHKVMRNLTQSTAHNYPPEPKRSSTRCWWKKGHKHTAAVMIPSLRGSVTRQNRLYTMTIAESAWLAWALRCKWRIDSGGEPAYEIRPSTNAKKYKTKALEAATVWETWLDVTGDPAILDGSLTKHWNTGVLVSSGLTVPPQGEELPG
ncbi:hypothetical protein NMY22_g9000 [Coprinellus aureogranulatus]|nr:hypothetical protein NMY22_g9000 [Coprinellus aureogranulatus]